MIHLSPPSLLIAHKYGPIAEARDVEKEQNKRFQGLVAHAVVRPRTVVVHLVNTDIALAAVMHSQHLLRSTLHALIGFGVDNFRVP